MEQCVATFDAALKAFHEDRKIRGLDPVEPPVKSETWQGTLFTFYKGTVLFRKVDSMVSVSSLFYSLLIRFGDFDQKKALFLLDCIT